MILIPYAQDDRFNRACSPTKIMDGLGSGRPIVATAIPECRLYAHLFDVTGDAGEFVDAARSIVATGCDDGRACLRHGHRREHTRRIVADQVLRLLQCGSPALELLAKPAPAHFRSMGQGTA